MGNSSDVLRIAAGEIGYSRWNDPEQGTKYGRWYAELTKTPYFGTNGVPYCAMFASWVLAAAGVKCNGMPSASCPSIMAAAGSAALGSKTDAQPGDVVLFDWDGNGNPDHVGIVERNCGSHLQTIEGNTSSGSSGSQSNGGGVHRRTRPWSSVRMVVRPQYGGAQPPAPAPAPKPNQSRPQVAVDGFWGTDTTRLAQQIAGLVADGEVWHQYSGNKGILKGCTYGWKWDGTLKGSPLIKWMQRHVLGIAADGLAGKDFANAMIRKYGNGYCDGRLDAPSEAIKGFQRALNQGRF